MPEQDSAARHRLEASPRSRAWLWASVLAVAMMVAAAVVYVVIVRGKQDVPAAPQPTITVTKTVSPPAPKLSPAPRESGTAFYDRIPSTLGAYALTATAENPAWGELGAFDSYTLTYSDGDRQVTLLAGQWRTDEAAAEAFDALGGPAGWPGGQVDLTATTCPQPPDPDVKAIWSNRTAVFQVDAPAGGAGELYCLMPM
ncbi:MAG: hypothetical protein LBD70_05810 [Bifidobacteriaceae bacterium]|jgi:hypothetical protein|nr:hypothetical protein [Bifidobacteriaceae bacterium]